MPVSLLILAAIALLIFYNAERNNFRICYALMVALVVPFVGLLCNW